MYEHRTLEASIKAALGEFPVLIVTGPRQVGKTTVLKHLSKSSHHYVTLDDPVLQNLAKEEPQLFLQRFPPPVLIDEIQYAPELLPYIKIHVDRHKRAGDFLLTGSQQFHLMKGVSESLAGRIAILNLLGLSLKEIQKQSQKASPFLPLLDVLQALSSITKPLSLKEIYELIWRGSFPSVVMSKTLDRDLFYGSYVQTYLQRDVRDLLQVGDLSTFHKFLRAAAARTSQLLNISDMSRDCGISPTTAKKWLSVLETSGIVYLLEPYHVNVTKRLIKTPKLYFLDTGLASYLTEWSSPETLEAGAMSGPILETFVFSEILKSYWHNGKRAPLYYYRDKDKKEIDLLITQNNIVYPLEIKKSASPGKQSISHFQVLDRLRLTIGQGGVLCLSQTLFPITSSIEAIPIQLI